METAPSLISPETDRSFVSPGMPHSHVSPEINFVSPEIFWGEIAPCEHLVNFYDNHDDFLQYLTLFVTGGFRNGESVILIATPEHLEAVEDRLSDMGFNPLTYQSSSQLIVRDAQDMLDSFMVDGWPNEELFNATILEILSQASSRGMRVRAFGEMVALLWANGHSAATVRLEYLWHKLCNSKQFTLLCAYPRSGFTTTPLEAIEEIYSAHSKVVRANGNH